MGDGAPGEPYSLSHPITNSRTLPGAARVLSLSHPIIIIIISYQNEEI